MRFGLVGKTVASALREVSDEQVPAWLHIPHKAEGRVEVWGRLASKTWLEVATVLYCRIDIGKRQHTVALLDEKGQLRAAYLLYPRECLAA